MLALALTSFLGVAAFAVPAAAATAAPNDELIVCPPATQKVGVAVDSQIDDPENGNFAFSVPFGALPPGTAVVKHPGLANHYEGVPTTVGTYNFTLRLTAFSGKTQDQACSVNVVSDSWATERVGGADRYETSVLTAKRVQPGTATIVYIASGENFADALSASAIAAQRGAPLMLATSTSVPKVVADAVSAYDPAHIVVIGGENTLKPVVISALQTAASRAEITRIGGVDRYAVSRALIQDARFGAPSTSANLFVASGQVFPDALSASPAASSVSTPVLLVNGGASGLSADEKALLTARGVTKATLFGGSDTLSTGIENDLRATAGTATRVEGVNRYVGSAKVAGAFFPVTPPSDTVYFATGATYPDALAGGVLAGQKKAPILLVSKSCMMAEVAAEVRRLNPAKIVLLGGPSSLDATLGDLPVCP